MSTIHCPHCGATVSRSERWAWSAVSTLSQAPAVPGMASLVRCGQCQQLFAEPAALQRVGWAGLWPVAGLVALLLGVALLA